MTTHHGTQLALGAITCALGIAAFALAFSMQTVAISVSLGFGSLIVGVIVIIRGRPRWLGMTGVGIVVITAIIGGNTLVQAVRFEGNRATMEITGSTHGRVAISYAWSRDTVTFGALSTGTRNTAHLPWREDKVLLRPYATPDRSPRLEATGPTDSDSNLTCRITIGSHVVAEQTANGKGAHVLCEAASAPHPLATPRPTPTR